MDSFGDRLIATELSASLGQKVIGHRIIVLESTRSTNDFLAQMLTPELPEGFVVFAETQTAGRGQRGNSWASAPHPGRWFSILLRPRLPLSETARLTDWAAGAVAATIRSETGIEPAIKPPNDVYVDGRKVSGVLVETKVGANPHDATAIGDRRFVINEFDSTMDVVRDGRVVGSVPTDAQPGGVAHVGGLVYVNAVRAYTVEPYTDADRPQALGGQSSGLGTSHVVAGPNGLLALGDTRGKALVVYATKPRLKFRARIPLAGSPVGLAWDGKKTMWITLSEKNQVVPVDLSGAEPKVGTPVATTQTPLSAAVDTATGRLAVAGSGDGKLLLVDP